MIIRYSLAGVISSALAAPFAGAIAGFLVAGPFGLLFGSVIGTSWMLEAVKIAGLPAILLGGALWTAGETRLWVRRRLLWAGIGCLVGILAFGLVVALPMGFRDLTDSPGIGSVRFAIAFTAAGACAALMFRLQMHVLLLFILEKEET